MTEKQKPVEINFEFREKLNEVLGGNHHNYCYQCGACVAQCPAARYSERFNPRSIMLDALLGREDVLLGPDSPIWLCTNHRRSQEHGKRTRGRARTGLVVHR